MSLPLLDVVVVADSGQSNDRHSDPQLLVMPSLHRSVELMVPASGSAADQARHGGSRSPGGVSHLIESEPRD